MYKLILDGLIKSDLLTSLWSYIILDSNLFLGDFKLQASWVNISQLLFIL